MRKSLIVLAAAGVLMSAVLADESAEQRIHIDVSAISDTADVAPVDGIRSAGQPDEEALQVFADAGYVAVIDMRGGDEDRGFDEEVIVRQLGLEYIPLPVVGAEALSYDTARDLAALLEDVDGPVLLHCGSGNRVGAILALQKSLEGADKDAAIAYGKSAGLTRLEGVVRQRLENE